MTESDNKRKGYREFWIKGQICHEFEVVNSIKVIDVQAAEDLQTQLAAKDKVIAELREALIRIKTGDVYSDGRKILTHEAMSMLAGKALEKLDKDSSGE